MASVVLFSYFRSTATWRVRIVMNLKLVPQELNLIWVRGDGQNATDHLAMGPHGLVPAMRNCGTATGQFVATIEYLDEAYPEPPLLPPNPVKRTQVRAVVQLLARDIHPLGSWRILQCLRNGLDLSDTQAKDWEFKRISAGYLGLEGQVDGHARTHLLGDAVTMADLCLAPQPRWIAAVAPAWTWRCFPHCTALAATYANCLRSRRRIRTTSPIVRGDPDIAPTAVEAARLFGSPNGAMPHVSEIRLPAACFDRGRTVAMATERARQCTSDGCGRPGSR